MQRVRRWALRTAARPMAASEDKAPEEWAAQPGPQRLLTNILAHPHNDHAAEVTVQLRGVLLDAHVAGIVGVLEKGRVSTFANTFTTDAGVALHAVLYHLLGGAALNLPPPRPASRDEVKRCGAGWTAATKAAAKFAKDMIDARRRMREGGDDTLLRRLRSSTFAPAMHKNLRRPDVDTAPPGKQAAATAAALTAAAAPSPDPADPAKAELRRRASCCLALAMGTHNRLGLQSRVHKLRGHDDVFRLIAEHAELRTTEWFSRPLPKELTTLRRHLRLEHGERRMAEELLSDAHVTIEELRTQLTRALRREESAVAAARRRVAEEEARAGEVREGAAEWQRLQQGAWDQQRKKERWEDAQAARAEIRWLTDRLAELQENLQQQSRTAEMYLADRLRDQDVEMRGERQRLADARKQAEADRREAERVNAQLEQQYQEQLAALERLRNARNGSALERQRALEAEVKQLKQRRTGNQRRIKEYNLAEQRVKVAQQQQARAEQSLREYGVSAEAERAANEHADQLEKELTATQAALKEQTEIAAKYKAVAEPPVEKFFKSGHYTSEVDLTSLEVIANLGVSACVVPVLFVIFSTFFGVTIPSREKMVQLEGVDAEGKRRYGKRSLLYVPGKTHMKELPAIGAELHKIQAGQWLLEDIDASHCYVADGASAMQKEILAQLYYRRNETTGKLESMALSLDECADKTAAGQHKKFAGALSTMAEAWSEADELGLLNSPDFDDALPPSPAATSPSPEPATAEEQMEQQRRERREELRRRLRGKIAAHRPKDCMNDRNSTARKAGRMALGGDGSGGEGDAADTATCAHHAVANVGEEGRKGIDKVLKGKMNITDEQAEGDSAKVKALRTSVGWFSSPACSLIYQVSKYVALFSSKGYAIGENFAQWLAHKLKTSEAIATELIGHVEDLLAICGGRDYVFFLDAAVVDRFSQLESLYGYLLEEADLGAEAGGKLRKAIITGFESVYCMAAVRSMAIIADAWLWPMLRAIEPGDDVHILDVCPVRASV